MKVQQIVALGKWQRMRALESAINGVFFSSHTKKIKLRCR
jgi:hypothetical protein